LVLVAHEEKSVPARATKLVVPLLAHLPANDPAVRRLGIAGNVTGSAAYSVSPGRRR
jgi:hypothetical protein